MGFLSPKTPAAPPAPPPPPPPPTPAQAPAVSQAATQAVAGNVAAQRARGVAAAGSGSTAVGGFGGLGGTNLTGGQGLVEQANTAPKSLLGG